MMDEKPGTEEKLIADLVGRVNGQVHSQSWKHPCMSLVVYGNMIFTTLLWHR
jgi:hypothetical protein